MKILLFITTQLCNIVLNFSSFRFNIIIYLISKLFLYNHLDIKNDYIYLNKLNNLDMNKNEEKINLIKQIYEYNKKGYNLDKQYSISDDIDELKFQLALLQENERKLHIEKELKFYELLKYCYGSNEYN